MRRKNLGFFIEKGIKSVVKICLLWYNNNIVKEMVRDEHGGIAQLVRALASHARGRRFESYCPYQSEPDIVKNIGLVFYLRTFH